MAQRERDILERADHTIAQDAAGTAGPGVGFRRFIAAMTLVVCLATVAIPYWVDRAFRRWWEANRPLAPVGTRLRRIRTRYRARQDSLADGAEILRLL